MQKLACFLSALLMASAARAAGGGAASAGAGAWLRGAGCGDDSGPEQAQASATQRARPIIRASLAGAAELSSSGRDRTRSRR